MAFWRAKYGESTTSTCPLCERPAIVRNAQGIAVCSDHKTTTINASCPSCKAALDLKDGKFGKFFLCASCGPISMKKCVIARNTTNQTTNAPIQSERRVERANSYTNADGSEKWVRSDDPRFEFR